MAALSMTSQIHLALEGLIAEVATEGFIPRVLPHMRDQVGALAEGLQAHGALVWLLAWNRRKINKHN